MFISILALALYMKYTMVSFLLNCILSVTIKHTSSSLDKQIPQREGSNTQLNKMQNILLFKQILDMK